MPKNKKEKSSKEKITPVIEEVVDQKVSIEKEELAVNTQPDEKIVEQPQVKSVKKTGFDFKLLLALTVVVATATGLLAGGFYVYFTGLSRLNPEEDEGVNYPTPVAVATAEPQSSPNVVDEEVEPEENIDVSLYKIQVLNGSGKIGEASKVEKILMADDYEVANVGNASSYNYKQTEISYKKDVPAIVVNNLKDLLSKAYDISEKDGENLADSGTYDIVITVGSQ